MCFINGILTDIFKNLVQKEYELLEVNKIDWSGWFGLQLLHGVVQVRFFSLIVSFSERIPEVSSPVRHLIALDTFTVSINLLKFFR